MAKNSFLPALIGFIASIALTAIAYAAVTAHWFGGWMIAVLILALAFIQLAVQLLFFLDLGFESGPRWRLFAFLSMFGFVMVIVAGSVWIMGHLNYNMMASPDSMQQYILDQQGF